MFITPVEIGKILIITIAAGLIFRQSLGLHKHFSLGKSILLAGALTAPAIILHELAHKLAAVSFGFEATLEVPWIWLAIGVGLAVFNAPLVFFVPAFVAFSGDVTPIANLVISLVGPGMNLLIYIIAIIVMRFSLSLTSRTVWTIIRRMNGFLFLFNIIPIPGFDGYHALSAILALSGIQPLS